MTQAIPNSHQRVYDRIVAAARAGQQCPMNSTLCDLIGAGSSATVSAIVRKLEVRGLIEVDRFQNGRDVRIPSLGIACAPWPHSREVHWRLRPGRPKRPPQSGGRRKQCLPLDIGERPDESNLPPAVYRDPCPRCGTRMDIGCEHQPARIGMGAFA